jgi:hypothetical protein
MKKPIGCGGACCAEAVKEAIATANEAATHTEIHTFFMSAPWIAGSTAALGYQLLPGFGPFSHP